MVTEAVPQPSADEVRISVQAIGLNRAEVMFREGAYLETPVLPSRLGYEAAGIVDAVGEDVISVKVGDRVSTIPAFSMGTYGVYSDTVIVPARAVAHYPDNLSAQEGASIWMQYITAYGALIDVAGLKEGQTVLLTAASSSVGIAAIQIARSIGARCIATTRGSEKSSLLQTAGANHVIVTDSENLEERIAEITLNEGAHVIFDPIGGPIVDALANAAAQGAMLVEYGALDPRPTPFPLFPALAKGLTIRGYTLFEITQDDQRLARAKAFIYDGLRTGSFRPLLDKNFAFDDVVNAHRYMESNQQVGKITLSV